MYPLRGVFGCVQSGCGVGELMTYFADLSPYEYVGSESGTRNVGWLGNGSFLIGSTSEEFQAKLLEFCHDHVIVHIARGFHTCELCSMDQKSDLQWFSQNQDRYGPEQHWASIGDGEIRVIGENAIYAAPALIYHYVVEHKYFPPVEFIESVLDGPQPGSTEHTKLIQKLGADGARLAQYKSS
jgi:hypothetical protein